MSRCSAPSLPISDAIILSAGSFEILREVKRWALANKVMTGLCRFHPLRPISNANPFGGEQCSARFRSWNSALSDGDIKTAVDISASRRGRGVVPVTETPAARKARCLPDELECSLDQIGRIIRRIQGGHGRSFGFARSGRLKKCCRPRGRTTDQVAKLFRLWHSRDSAPPGSHICR